MGDEVEVTGFVENSEKAICFHVSKIIKLAQSENIVQIRQKGKDLQDSLQLGALGQRFSRLNKNQLKFKSGKAITPLCSTWWKNAQNCPKGDSCKRRHHFVDDEEKARYEMMYQKYKIKTTFFFVFKYKRRLEQKKQGHDPDDPCDCKTSHYLRAIVFVDWLLKTFSKEVLASGTGVLDIAGGKGAVSVI